jgi:hypothetical protein
MAVIGGDAVRNGGGGAEVGIFLGSSCRLLKILLRSQFYSSDF